MEGPAPSRCPQCTPADDPETRYYGDSSQVMTHRQLPSLVEDHWIRFWRGMEGDPAVTPHPGLRAPPIYSPNSGPSAAVNGVVVVTASAPGQSLAELRNIPPRGARIRDGRNEFRRQRHEQRDARRRQQALMQAQQQQQRSFQPQQQQEDAGSDTTQVVNGDRRDGPNGQ